MAMWGSCGHQLKEEDGPRGMGWVVSVKGYVREGDPSIKVMVVCTKCRKSYENQGELLRNEDEEDIWMDQI